MGDIRDAFLAIVLPNVVEGVDLTTRKLAEESAELAPISKGRKASGDFSKGERIAPRLPGEFGAAGSAAFNEADEAGFAGMGQAEIARSGKITEINSEEVAKFFRYTRGPRKGESPDRVVVKGRSIRGTSGHKPGTLKAGIHSMPAMVEGTRVTGSVRSEAPYSYYVEFALGKGGESAARKRNAGFMRKPLKQLESERAGGIAKNIRRIG